MSDGHGSKLALSLVFAFFSSLSCFACSCGESGPACAGVTAADIVFVGTPVYTNEDHSGTFLQQTLYRFEVEEIFKGLPDGTKEVWVDPGSFTSCYAEYKLGTKLLVFGSKRWGELGNSAAMTVAAPGGKTKPLPPGFDPKMPVYYVPECSGTRDAAPATAEIAWLRSWQHGETRTRIYGNVLDELGFGLKGARVTAKGKLGSMTTTTDADGGWSFDTVRAGRYALSAELPTYRLGWNPLADAPEAACAYFKLPMAGSGALSGIVVNSSRKRVAGIAVDLVKVSGDHEFGLTRPRVISAKDGSFSFKELPAGDFAVGVNLTTAPSSETPYEKTYLTGIHIRQEAEVLHLKPGQTISGLQMHLPQRLGLRTVRVRVLWPDGRSAGKGVGIEANVAEDGGSEFEQTNAEGVATLHCLASVRYKVVARMWLSGAGENPVRRAVSPSQEIAPGTEPISITVVLSETRIGDEAFTD